MCGAYGFGGFSGFKDSINILLRLQIQNKLDLQESPNIRPSMKALAVHKNSPNTGEYIKFGFPTPWDETKLLINAKSETAPRLRTFFGMFREGRCLVPATHYFEWKKNDDGSKTPYVFRLKDEKVFCFAGLYNEKGFVILTTRPNPKAAKVHHRMPCILSKDDEEKWLNKETEELDLIRLLDPFPEEKMEAYAVSSLVNSAKVQDGDAILRPYRAVKQEALV
jgi:putative SOS response-associated peptidase YedK